MSKTITALFNNTDDSSKAISKLEGLGVSHEHISVVVNDSYKKEDFEIKESNKAAEGVAIGAIGTGMVGAIAAGLTAVGAIVSGGAGILVAGPVAAALAGAGAGAAVGGGIGGVIGAFIPDHELTHFEEAIEKGAIMISVDDSQHSEDEIKSALSSADPQRVTVS